MPRILIVEDELSIATLLRDDLALEGHEVDIVSDGEAAIAALAPGRFDLAILDVMLPGKDGFEVCRALRGAGLRMPIIMLTAKTQESDKVMGLEIGADDYVTKPFAPRELRARVKAALRRAAVETPEIYRFGQTEVDFGRRELRTGGVPLEVTTIEFKLLSAFIRHRGRVLSREQLLNEVWGHGVFVTDRAVDTHIVNLRRKVEPDPAVPQYIVSVRGAGYRFDG
jgi:DNA-binding response OmpR family regulator